jgi:hypothetical protein
MDSSLSILNVLKGYSYFQGKFIIEAKPTHSEGIIVEKGQNRNFYAVDGQIKPRICNKPYRSVPPPTMASITSPGRWKPL